MTCPTGVRSSSDGKQDQEAQLGVTVPDDNCRKADRAGPSGAILSSRFALPDYLVRTTKFPNGITVGDPGNSFTPADVTP